MNPIVLLFKLLFNFVPFEQGEYERLFSEASTWWSKIREDGKPFEEGGKPPHPLLVKFKKFGQSWQGGTAGAVAYLVLTKEITRWQNSFDSPNEEEDDEL